MSPAALKPPVPRPDAPEGYRWTSCAREVNWTIGEDQHLIYSRPLQLTTLCGATASDPSIWRANRNKQLCPACLRIAREKRLIPKEAPVSQEQDTAMLDQPDPEPDLGIEPNIARGPSGGVALPARLDSAAELYKPGWVYDLLREAAEVLRLAEQHELEHIERHSDESLRASSGDEAADRMWSRLGETAEEFWARVGRAEPYAGTAWETQAEDASPEGQLRALPGWGLGLDATMYAGTADTARAIVEGLSVREYKEMLARIEDQFRANAEEKDILVYTKQYVTAVLRGGEAV